MTRFYYVYILECSDGTYYVGITNNVEQRVEQHNAGINESAYTFSRRPVLLKWYEVFQQPETAILYEKKIKKWSHAKKQALINGDFDLLPALSRNKRNREK